MINIRPAQSEKFALAHSSHDCQIVESIVAVPTFLGGYQQLLDFILVKDLHFSRIRLGFVILHDLTVPPSVVLEDDDIVLQITGFLSFRKGGLLTRGIVNFLLALIFEYFVRAFFSITSKQFFG